MERRKGNYRHEISSFHDTVFLGVLNVSPLNGTALNTSFEMTAPEGWVDPDGDALSFVFGYIVPDRAVLFSSQVETIITTQLPPGNLTMVVYCYDTFGAFSSATADVYVERAAISDAAYGNLEQQMAEAAALGDVGGLLGNAVILIYLHKNITRVLYFGKRALLTQRR